MVRLRRIRRSTRRGSNSASNLIAFIYPITATIKPFLAKKGDSAEQVEAMHQAWFKSVRRVSLTKMIRQLFVLSRINVAGAVRYLEGHHEAGGYKQGGGLA